MAQRLRRWARQSAGWFRRRRAAPAAAPQRRQAIVAATGRFPIGSHAFVYQEMLGLRDAGFDVTLFHWYREPRERLREGFDYLWEHAVQLQADWGLHEADLDYWKRARPGRLEALLARMATASGIPASELETRWELMQAYTFARMAESRGAAYVHSYFFYEQSLSAMVTAWLLGIPRGITAYADHMLDDWPLKLVALHVESADVVVATSRRIQRELIGIAGERFAPKILVKPNGIDGRPFAGPDRPQPVDGPFPLISVSRLEPKKGLLVLAEAVHLLAQRGRDVVVHVVGAADADNPTSMAYAERFVARLAELGLTDRFVLHGFQRQAGIAKLLREARVFVAPYVETATGDKDGIPTAMLEAMASGLPIVATDAGSILEVVSDGVEGLLVPQREPEPLAGAIERLIDAPALRDALGQRARQRFEREFDCRVTEKLLHERIAALLDRPQAPAAAMQPALAAHGAAGA
jgi:glycosyltransferase involved in cell wall biosynthesis